MKSTQTNKKTQKIRYTAVGVFIVIALAIGGGVFSFLSTNNKASADAPDSSKPTFVLDKAELSGWWSSGTVYPADGLTKDYIGDPNDLPIASISIHQGQDGVSGRCFVSMALKNGVADRDAELQKLQKSLGVTGGSVTQVTTKTSTLTIKEGQKEYQLSQYSVDGGSSKDVMKGLEVGYVQLDDRYIKVDGHCETVEELADTISVLQAYKLN